MLHNKSFFFLDEVVYLDYIFMKSQQFSLKLDQKSLCLQNWILFDQLHIIKIYIQLFGVGTDQHKILFVLFKETNSPNETRFFGCFGGLFTLVPFLMEELNLTNVIV